MENTLFLQQLKKARITRMMVARRGCGRLLRESITRTLSDGEFAELLEAMKAGGFNEEQVGLYRLLLHLVAKDDTDAQFIESAAADLRHVFCE